MYHHQQFSIPLRRAGVLNPCASDSGGKISTGACFRKPTRCCVRFILRISLALRTRTGSRPNAIPGTSLRRQTDSGNWWDSGRSIAVVESLLLVSAVWASTDSEKSCWHREIGRHATTYADIRMSRFWETLDAQNRNVP
jgi:hypothetical protein